MKFDHFKKALSLHMSVSKFILLKVWRIFIKKKIKRFSPICTWPVAVSLTDWYIALLVFPLSNGSIQFSSVTKLTSPLRELRDPTLPSMEGSTRQQRIKCPCLSDVRPRLALVEAERFAPRPVLETTTTSIFDSEVL